jgi:hypothetical protein
MTKNRKSHYYYLCFETDDLDVFIIPPETFKIV